MRTMSRSWPALFAWGAGLLHVALGAEIGVASAVAMVALLLQGAGEFAWGIVSLRSERAVARRTALAGAITGVVLAAASVPFGGSPFAVAATIALVVPAAMLASRGDARPSTRGRPWSRAVGVVTGGVIVAGLLGPALSTTAVPHHEHGHVVSLDPHAGH
ncbi:hypothetical protein [Microbacterium candidum]|uniref:Uncharacterized protein n=1 Tax=Microbacterium candidum TaxID=3041922 RepID=A0ABT7MWD4_9MICO|nr:hypothetical protein [Microbacterium sp. ASV49]MDL9978762.1 hypothetical protein [Microbacterium sp. ASV49]